MKVSVASLLKSASILSLALLAVAAADAPRTVWDGVYSAAQAARGQKVYAAECARCHGDKLEGIDDAPGLTNKAFQDAWNGKPLGRLVDITRRTMPPETAGTMSRPTTIDVVAYMLSANGYPAGPTDLTTNAAALREIMIEAKKP